MDGTPEERPIAAAIHRNDSVGNEHTPTGPTPPDEIAARLMAGRSSPGYEAICESLGIDYSELNEDGLDYVLSLLRKTLPISAELSGRSELLTDEVLVQVFISNAQAVFLAAFTAGVRYEQERRP